MSNEPKNLKKSTYHLKFSWNFRSR